MPTNPLAISTGMNQGEAQVLNIPQSNYYADKLAQAKKADADVANDIGTTLAKTPWANDMPEFKQMQSDIRTFVKDNRAALVKGDFDAKIQLEKMKQDYLNRYEESKAAEKFYDKMTGYYLSNQDRYYDKDYDDMLKLAEGGSKTFNAGAVRLRKNFDPVKYISDLESSVKAIPEVDKGAYLQKIKDDTDGKTYTYLVQSSGNKKEKLSDVADRIYDAWANKYTEQQMLDKNQTREAARKYAENYLKSKLKYDQPYDAEARKSSSGLGDFDINALSNPSKSKYKTGGIYQFDKDAGTYAIGASQDDTEGYRIAANTAPSNVGSTEGARIIDLTDDIIIDVPKQGKKTFKKGASFTDKEIKALNDYVAAKLAQEPSKAAAYEVGFFTSKSGSGSENTTYLPTQLDQQNFEPVIGVSVIRTADGFSARTPMTASDVAAERNEAVTKAKKDEFALRMYHVYYALQDQKKEVENSNLPEDKKKMYYKQVDDIIDGLNFNQDELDLFKRKYSNENNNVSSGSGKPPVQNSKPNKPNRPKI